MFTSIQGELSLIHFPKFRHCEEGFCDEAIFFLTTKYEIASSRRTLLAMTDGLAWAWLEYRSRR